VELTKVQAQLSKKSIEIEKSQQLFQMFDQQIRDFQGMIGNHETSKSLYKDTIIKYLTELEDHRRKERRLWINEQGIRLGRVSSMRQGPKIVEVWEEGD
jgi:hypothetical protein